MDMDFFMSRVTKQDNGCWFRGAGLSRPQAYRDGKTEPMARAVWRIFKGPIEPDSLCVCHTCDEPRCVNPEHLFLGTHAENVADRVRKNRSYRPPPVPSTSRDRGLCFLLTNIDPAFWADVKARAAREGHPLRFVLLQLLREYITHGLRKDTRS